MRVRRLALAAALLAALALASCSGGESPQAATPEAASTPAPTATATPEAASTPAPTVIATPEEQIEHPIPGASGVSGADASSPSSIRPLVTTDIAVARRFPLWRDPALPEGWRLYEAQKGTASAPYPDGYVAFFVDEEGWGAVEIFLYHRTIRPYRLSAWHGEKIRETRIIDGHPALVEYAPDNQLFNTQVSIFNRATGLAYVVSGSHSSLSGRHIDRTIEIARSLYRTPP